MNRYRMPLWLATFLVLVAISVRPLGILAIVGAILSAIFVGFPLAIVILVVGLGLSWAAEAW